MNYNEFDAYFLYEDIISFIQFNLLLNTQTKIVQNPEDFNFIYLKNNKYQKFGDIKKLNDADIRKFKVSKQNNDFYTYYKKSKSSSNKINDNIEKKGEIEENKGKEKDKESKVLSNTELFHEIMKQNPKVALMNEIREQEKENEYSKKNTIRTKHKVSSSSSININNENDVDDFFSDVKVTNLYDNIEKKKEKEKQEKMEKMKKKTFNIESLLKQYEEPEDIMKELEEEQKRWEAKVNSSASSFSLPSLNSNNSKNNKKNDYTINLYNYNNMNKKEQKHFIVEKQLENKIDETKMLLKDRDLVSSGRKKELLEERKKKGETNSNLDKDDKSMSTSTYLSFLSKNQRYPY
jgi:hypothetical protein